MENIQAHQLTMAYGQRVLFSDVSFRIGSNSKIGLIGNNGAGKTTLFKIMIGKELATEGELFISKETKIGYMQQHICVDEERTLYDEIITVFAHLIELEKENERLLKKMEQGNHELELIEQQMKVQEAYIDQGGMTYRSRARATLLGLGFQEEDFTRNCKKLSGGENSKISLGKLLLSDANFLLLDEPTNHLDIPSVQWLESFLEDFQGSVLVISHDRYFLDKVTNQTMLIENQKLFSGKGNYSAFMQEMQVQREIEQHHYERVMQEAQRLEGIIEQQRRWNRERNIRMAESKEKQLEKLLETAVRPEEQEASVRFVFQPKQESGQEVLLVENLSKTFAKAPLFEDVSFKVRKRERVFLLGGNGVGKTTLLRMILKQESFSRGDITLGASIKVGYFEQAFASLHLEKTVLDEVWDDFSSLSTTEIRNALAAFLFRGDEVNQRISTLSGGERARISILKLMLSGANFLLLDEPTNHLDIASREVLENALRQYEGTLLVISHDRYFINKLASRILWLTPSGVTEYWGNYDYFLEKQKETPETNDTVESIQEAKKTNAYEQKKEYAGKVRRAAGKIKRVEEKIRKLEKEMLQTQEKMLLPDVASDYEQVGVLGKRLTELEQTVEELLEEWERESSVLHDLEKEPEAGTV